MNEQDKQLLLKDLGARLPYGVVFMGNKEWNRKPYQLTCDELQYAMMSDDWDDVPYLRQLSSMTDEERKELKSILREKDFGVDVHEELIIYTDTEYDCEYYFSDFYEVQDWLNAHYFDYRGLIPKGLALPAPEGMYNIKTE